MLKYISFLALFIALVSCSSTPNREELRKFRLIEKKDLERCQVIDAVTGENSKGLETLAIEDAKAKALKLNADSLYIEESVANGSEIIIKAAAYQCKK